MFYSPAKLSTAQSFSSICSTGSPQILLLPAVLHRDAQRGASTEMTLRGPDPPPGPCTPPYVPQETAIADDATTPLAHSVRQGVGAEEQLPGAQWGHGTQPISPVGGCELFHLQCLHHSTDPNLRSAPQTRTASLSLSLVFSDCAPASCACVH